MLHTLRGSGFDCLLTLISIKMEHPRPLQVSTMYHIWCTQEPGWWSSCMAAHILSLKYCTCISVYKVFKMFTASEQSVFMTLGPCIQYISGIWLICMHTLVSCQPVGCVIQKHIGALRISLHAHIGQQSTSRSWYSETYWSLAYIPACTHWSLVNQ